MSQEEERDKGLPKLQGFGVNKMGSYVIAAYEGQRFYPEVSDQEGSCHCLSYMLIKGNNSFR